MCCTVRYGTCNIWSGRWQRLSLALDRLGNYRGSCGRGLRRLRNSRRSYRGEWLGYPLSHRLARECNWRLHSRRLRDNRLGDASRKMLFRRWRCNMRASWHNLVQRFRLYCWRRPRRQICGSDDGGMERTRALAPRSFTRSLHCGDQALSLLLEPMFVEADETLQILRQIFW